MRQESHFQRMVFRVLSQDFMTGNVGRALGERIKQQLKATVNVNERLLLPVES